MNIRFEYLIMVVTAAGVVVKIGKITKIDQHNLDEVLDDLGSKGWELTAVSSFKDTNQNQRERYIFKRAIQVG